MLSKYLTSWFQGTVGFPQSVAWFLSHDRTMQWQSGKCIEFKELCGNWFENVLFPQLLYYSEQKDCIMRFLSEVYKLTHLSHCTERTHGRESTVGKLQIQHQSWVKSHPRFKRRSCSFLAWCSTVCIDCLTRNNILVRVGLITCLR